MSHPSGQSRPSQDAAGEILYRPEVEPLLTQDSDGVFRRLNLLVRDAAGDFWFYPREQWAAMDDEHKARVLSGGRVCEPDAFNENKQESHRF